MNDVRMVEGKLLFFQGIHADPASVQRVAVGDGPDKLLVHNRLICDTHDPASGIPVAGRGHLDQILFRNLKGSLTVK